MPLIQYGPALGVGTVGHNELMDFDSSDAFEEQEFLERINAVLPPGLRFKTLATLPVGAQSLIKGINRAEYEVSLDAVEVEAALERTRCGRGDLAAMDARAIHGNMVQAFMARKSCIIERVRKDKRQQVDVRRYTRGLNLVEDWMSLRMVTQVSPSGGVKPIEVMAAVYGLTRTEMISLSSRVRRLRLYWEDETSAPVDWVSGIAAARTSGQGDKLRVTGSHSQIS